MKTVSTFELAFSHVCKRHITDAELEATNSAAQAILDGNPDKANSIIPGIVEDKIYKPEAVCKFLGITLDEMASVRKIADIMNAAIKLEKESERKASGETN